MPSMNRLINRQWTTRDETRRVHRQTATGFRKDEHPGAASTKVMSVAPTGKRITFHGLARLRTVDGRIVRFDVSQTYKSLTKDLLTGNSYSPSPLLDPGLGRSSTTRSPHFLA
jgi:hypothetical protein